MPIITYIELLVIECDYPECGHIVTVPYENNGFYTPDVDALKAKGWVATYYGGDSYLMFCDECKNKELPTDRDRRYHECLYVTTKKDGTPSEYGHYSRCVICDQDTPS